MLLRRPWSDLTPEERAEQLAEVERAWAALLVALRPAFEAITAVLNDPWFRRFAAAYLGGHRAEVRRVHSAYRRRTRGRWYR